jgi:hypothetical protein
MWQTFKSLATTEHAQGRMWRIKESKLEKNILIFWFSYEEYKEAIEQSATMFMVWW